MSEEGDQAGGDGSSALARTFDRREGCDYFFFSYVTFRVTGRVIDQAPMDMHARVRAPRAYLCPKFVR
jgi:hypothetical protein